MEHPEALFTPKELAFLLKRARTYVYAMKRQGFKMPGGKATLGEARAWEATHPAPRGNQKEIRQ